MTSRMGGDEAQEQEYIEKSKQTKGAFQMRPQKTRRKNKRTSHKGPKEKEKEKEKSLREEGEKSESQDEREEKRREQKGESSSEKQKSRETRREERESRTEKEKKRKKCFGRGIEPKKDRDCGEVLQPLDHLWLERKRKTTKFILGKHWTW